MIKLKIKKGDEVIIIKGKDKGQRGEVSYVFPKLNKVIVRGVNQFDKHLKRSSSSEGGIIKKEMPINISNLALIDPVQNRATKVGFKILENGKKVRYAKVSGEIIDKDVK